MIVLCAAVAVCQAGFLDSLLHRSHHESSGHGISTQSVTLDHGHGHGLSYDDDSHQHHDEHVCRNLKLSISYSKVFISKIF